MFAVVQIGSNDRRSPCITPRIVLAGVACARAKAGANPVNAAAATPPFSTLRRVVVMRASSVLLPPRHLPSADLPLFYRGLTHGSRWPATPPARAVDFRCFTA